MWGEALHEDFLVFDTQLDMNGVDDEDEDEEGAYIAYNNDDDNENGQADYDDDENASEDDLVEITLIDCLPSGITGDLELKVVFGNIKVWSDEHKGDLVIPNGEELDNYDVQWGIGSVPASLWVEGSGTGSGQLSLRYSPNGTSFPGELNADIINVTMVHVEMFMDGVADSEEESVGGYIALGSGNTRIDLYAVSGAPFDEDHPMILDVDYGSMGSGTIEIWDYSNPLAPVEVDLPATYDSFGDLPDDLRVKGALVSYAVNYITLIWEYSIQGRSIQDRIGVTVVEADLDIDGVDDDDEESVGQEVLLNFDDNDAPRKKVILRKVTPNDWDGDVILSRSNTKVELFDSVTEGTKITFDDSDNRFANSGLPKSLWVEGSGVSGSMRDVALELEAEGISYCDDTVCFTVIKVDILEPKGSLDATENPSASWLPSPNRFDFQGLKSGATGAYVLDIEGNIAPAPDPPVSYKWTLDAAAGTLTDDTTSAPTHTAPGAEGQGMLTLTALIDSTDTGLKDEKEVKIYKDHLARDYANFETGGSCDVGWRVTAFNVTSPWPEMIKWNCHGSTLHHWNGSGTGSSSVLPTTGWTPKKLVEVTHYSSGGGSHPSLGTLNRGDIVAYYKHSGALMHSQTCTGSGTETYGANNEPLSLPGAPSEQTWKWATSTAGDWANDLWLEGTGIMPVKIVVYIKP